MSQRPRVIAFYLPQFHPIPENDAWWGKGFTEWTNVAKAKPLFPGHYQPRIPADLGFYDLRVPETREEQARLAREAGVDAFCYWHYWFGNGKQLLEMPLQEVVKSGTPDFPFCLGWANHSWYKKEWNKDISRFSNELLIEQTYPGEEDIKAHFYKMLPVFKDPRYYKNKEGRSIFLFSNPEHITNINMFIDVWQELAIKNGLPPFFFIGYVANTTMLAEKSNRYLDALVLSARGNLTATLSSKIKNKLCGLLRLPINVINYKTAVKKWSKMNEFKKEHIYPAIFPNWDHSPRMGAGGLILHNSTPELFKQHVITILEKVMQKSENNRIIFIKSWNEWAEGNHMEPDLRFGRGYIDALNYALSEFEKSRSRSLQ